MHLRQRLPDRLRRRILDADVIAGTCGFLIQKRLQRIGILLQYPLPDRLPRMVGIRENDDPGRVVRFVDALPGLAADAE